MTDMRCAPPVLLLLLGSLSALGQDDVGMAPRWEVQRIGADLVDYAAGVRTVLAEVRTEAWTLDGASEATAAQRDVLEKDLQNLTLSAQALSRYPEKLSVVFDTFVWLDRVDSIVFSLAAAVRRYQSPTVADLLVAAGVRSAGVEEDLKTYMRQLAVAAEAEMEVVHAEAQRCRAHLMAQPPIR